MSLTMNINENLVDCVTVGSSMLRLLRGIRNEAAFPQIYILRGLIMFAILDNVLGDIVCLWSLVDPCIGLSFRNIAIREDYLVLGICEDIVMDAEYMLASEDKTDDGGEDQEALHARDIQRGVV